MPRYLLHSQVTKKRGLDGWLGPASFNAMTCTVCVSPQRTAHSVQELDVDLQVRF